MLGFRDGQGKRLSATGTGFANPSETLYMATGSTRLIQGDSA